MPKFFITASRYVNGTFVYATPNQPAIIDVPANPKDKGLVPVEAGPPAKPKEHFSASANGGALHPQAAPVKTAPELFSTPVAPAADAKRPSDKKVI